MALKIETDFPEQIAQLLKFMLRYFRPTVVLTGTPSAAASRRAQSIITLIPRTLT